MARAWSHHSPGPITLPPSRGTAPTGLLTPSDTNGFAVDDDERPCKFHIGNFREQSLKGVLGFFDGGGPDSKSNDPRVGAKGECPLVRKIFVERDDHGLPLLGPGKELFIGPS